VTFKQHNHFNRSELNVTIGICIIPVILFILSCKTFSLTQPSPVLEYSTYTIQSETELSELGLLSIDSPKNPFWIIGDMRIDTIDASLKLAIQFYLKENSIVQYDSLFDMSQVHRQYSGFYDPANHKLLLIRCYKKERLKQLYGSCYADSLTAKPAPYYHLYPDFYYLVLNLEKDKVQYLKWR
jgi:hypothetical protein